MDPYWQKVEEGILTGLEMPEAQYKNWLVEFCDGDEKLKAEIESFLPLTPEVNNFFEKASYELSISAFDRQYTYISTISMNSSERNILESDDINHNLEQIQLQIKRIFMNHNELFWEPPKNTKPLKDLM